MDTSAVEQAEEQLRLAMLKSDVSALERLLAPELVFTTFLGESITKQQDIEAHQSGFLNMHSIALTERKILSRGPLFIVSCVAKIDATFDNDRTEQLFRFLRVWAETPSSDLHLIAGQATLVYASLGD